MQHPREREGFSETDSTQYCNSKKHLNQEEAQLLAYPPMHQIHQTEALKDYLRNTTVNMKKQTEDKQKRSIQKDGTRRNTEAKENHTTVKVITLYFTFMNIVLEIQT